MELKIMCDVFKERLKIMCDVIKERPLALLYTSKQATKQIESVI